NGDELRLLHSLDHSDAAQQLRIEAAFQGGFRGQDDVQCVAGIVRPLRAMDERSALQRHATVVLLDSFVRRYLADGHREIQFDDVAFLPGAADLDESMLEGRGDLAAIDGERGCIRDAIGKAIQAAGDSFSASPRRNADGEREVSWAGGVDLNANAAVPGIPRVLGEFYLGAFDFHARGAADEQVHIHDARRLRVNVSGQRGHEANHVGRATRGIDPLEALVIAEALEWVLVKEA